MLKEMLEKKLEDMIVRTGVRVDNMFYFVTTYCNVLFSLNIYNGQLQAVTYFGDQIDKTYELFSTMIEDKNKIYLLPRNGKKIIIYDWLKSEEKEIYIGNLLTQKGESWNHFFSAVLVENHIYLSPGMNTRICRLGLENLKPEGFIKADPNKEMKAPYFVGEPCHWEDQLIFVNIYAEIAGYYCSVLDIKTGKMRFMIKCKTLTGYAACAVYADKLIGMYRDGKMDIWDLRHDCFVVCSKGEHGEDLYYRSLYVAQDFIYGFSTNSGIISIYDLRTNQYRKQELPYSGYTYIYKIDDDRILAAGRNNKFVILHLSRENIIVDKEYDLNNTFFKYLLSMADEIFIEDDVSDLNLFCKLIGQDVRKHGKTDVGMDVLNKKNGG